MSTYHLSARDEGIRPIVRAAFPAYNGTKARIRVFTGPMGVNSYWDGGSREYFALVNLADRRSLGLPTSHPYFDRRPNGQPMGQIELRELPPGIVLVSRSIFCGKDTGVTVHVRADNLDQLKLPDAPQLTDDERTVLEYSRTLKSSYNGISNYRFVSAGREAETDHPAATRDSGAFTRALRSGFHDHPGRSRIPLRRPD